MKRILQGILVLAFFIIGLSSNAQQLLINRVTLMPDMPSPYIMRNWKNVATRYDSSIYNLTAAGQYLPLMHIQSSGGVNYSSIHPINLVSYVGNGATQAEAINIIPSLVGASLVGVDKSNQNGVNWVEKAKDFFNKANGQNVYLNGYSAATGSDWWYDLMPNVFFYQLYTQYPNTTDFADQFTAIADRQLQVVNSLGGSTTPWKTPNLNYRAFNLATLQPNTDGPAEPEAAGTIAWILYHAYVKTGDKKYLDGAQLAMTFLSGFGANPAYEIELPYGTFIAAKMNAELGTTFNISKMINWSFDQSSERNWGTIVGTWGDATTGQTSVSGLVGEVDDPSTGYAFTMNGYQQASALVPLVKYDKRFAHDVAKWTLNLANASRLFYSTYLPSSHQDDYAWTSAHDPNGLIGYESLKQINNNNTKNKNTLLYATGDNERGGGNTNLGLYGSSHVGYLGAIVNTTNVDGILLLDVNKTDFFGQNAFPSFLVFNPYTSAMSVNVPVGSGNVDIYDAISQTTIKTNVSGSVPVSIPASGVMLLSYLPAGTVTTPLNGKLMAGTKVVDYSYGYDFTGDLRIRSLSSTDSIVSFNQSVKVYSSVVHGAGPETFSWSINGTAITSSADSTLTWVVPANAGAVYLVLSVTDGVTAVKDSIHFNILSHIPVPPVVSGITMDSLFIYAGTTNTFICHSNGSKTGGYTYTWTPPAGGSIVTQSDSTFVWTAPAAEGIVSLSCTVTNSDAASTTVTKNVLVKIQSTGTSQPVAYFPLDADVLDYSGNGHNAKKTGVVPTTDVRGLANKAYLFSVGTDIIDVPNAPTLNFQDQITVSFWVKLSQWYEESYLISHGSYEERYKVSVIAGNILRWSIKTSTGTYDLDSSFPLKLNTFYHCTAVYTGYSMELYIGGWMNSYSATTGLLQPATEDVTFGRKDPTITQYDLHGTLDEVRIYDKGLEPNEIVILKTLFNSTPVTGLPEAQQPISVYPNPSHGDFILSGVDQSVAHLSLSDMTGREINFSKANEDQNIRVTYPAGTLGILLLKIETSNGVSWRKVIAY